jgi:hypothetical protein
MCQSSESLIVRAGAYICTRCSNMNIAQDSNVCFEITKAASSIEYMIVSLTMRSRRRREGRLGASHSSVQGCGHLSTVRQLLQQQQRLQRRPADTKQEI